MTKETTLALTDIETLSKPEKDILALGSEMRVVYYSLMDTFFPDQTWRFRQAVGYDLPLFEVGIDVKDYSEKDAPILKRIFNELGDRVNYIEAAYHIPDALSAIMSGTSMPWVDMKAGDETRPKSDVASEILAQSLGNILILGRDLEEFLDSRLFKRAFKIALDQINHDFTISDLHLDSNQIRKIWNRLQPKSEAEQKPTS